MKRILMLLLMLVCVQIPAAYSQITNFTSSSYANVYDSACRLKSFEIRPDGVVVTIEVKALKAYNRMKIPSSNSLKIITASDKIALLTVTGMLVNNEVISNYASYGWNRVGINETRSFQLYFKGHMPSGVTRISITDNYGYKFYNYTINNPRKNYVPSITTEAAAKQNIDSNNDGICGIYEYVGEGGATLACVKVSGEYKLIYLPTTSYKWKEMWKTGDIKADLRPTASGIMKADWYMANKSPSTSYVSFDGYSMRVLDNKNEESLYLKTYPVGSVSITGNGGRGEDTGEQWSGTGFALRNGYIVTNNHVVEGASSIVVIGVNGNRNTEYKATVVTVDKKNDLALIRINDSRFSGFNNIPYAVRNTQCETGDDVFVLGYPLTSYMGEEVKLTNGIISSLSGYQGDITTYQISAPVQPGNSGGPMFDKNGDVVGIVNSGIPNAENVGYAIKTSYLYSLINSASLSSVIPQTNSVNNGTLSDKVRSVKNFVFYIKCSK